jgi:hypothetical protein
MMDCRFGRKCLVPCPGCVAGDQPLHPLQAITDAPPLVPDLLDALETRHPTLGDGKPADRLIVAITGLAGSGKSTMALRLVEHHGFTRVRFAGPLKSMLAALGLSPAEIDGDRKEVPCDLLGGRTPRWAMQTLGTEWGRDLIANDLWIRAWNAAVGRTLPGSCIVVDDCRFPNEFEAVKALSGIVIRVERDGAGAGAAGHASEAFKLDADQIVHNNGTLDQLAEQVDAIARDLSWAIAGTH